MILLNLLFGLVVAAHASSRPLPFYSCDDMSPFWKTEKPHLCAATVPAFSLINQDNHPVTEMPGHISLVNFFFTSCGSVCPVMMNRLKIFQAQLPPDIPKPTIYSFSVDPRTDQPKNLRDYANARHLDLSHWSLLTGARSEIYRLGREVFHADGSTGSESFIHTTNVYLLDRYRRIRGIYDTKSSKDLALLQQDLRVLNRERSKP